MRACMPINENSSSSRSAMRSCASANSPSNRDVAALIFSTRDSSTAAPASAGSGAITRKPRCAPASRSTSSSAPPIKACRSRSPRSSLTLIRAAGAEAAGVVVALDREERSSGALSAIQEVEQRHGVPVYSLISLDHILDYLSERGEFVAAIEAIHAYRGQYGV